MISEIGLGNAGRKFAYVLLLLAMIALILPAASYALGITKNELKQPTSLNVGSTKTFKGDLHYDNTVGAVPVPSEVGLTVEIPKSCYQPTVVGYSDSVAMYEQTAGNSVCGYAAWQYRAQKWIFAPSDMYIELSVKGKTASTRSSYIGTRPFTSESDVAEYNSTRMLAVS